MFKPRFCQQTLILHDQLKALFLPCWHLPLQKFPNLCRQVLNTGCLRNGVTEVLSNISLVFGARDLKLWINTVYYRTFDNQKMIWPLSPTRYFKWLCPKNFEKLENLGLWSMFFKNYNFEAFKGIFWPMCRKQKSLRIKFYPRKPPSMSILGPFWVIYSLKM